MAPRIPPRSAWRVAKLPRQSIWARLQAALRRSRWHITVIACVAMVCLTASHLLQQRHPAGRNIVVVSRSLPSGHTLTDGDLQTQQVTGPLAAGQSVTTTEARGKRLAHPLERGMPVTTSALRGTGYLTGLPSGTALCGLTLHGSAALPSLKVGDRVDVAYRSSAAHDNTTKVAVLARSALVVHVEMNSGSKFGGGQLQQHVLIATETARANDVATLGDAKGLGVTLVG